MAYALDTETIAWSLIFVFLLTRIAEGIYNIFFHPLSKFPGPKAAALSEWFQTYHEVICHHSMVDIFADLHSKYGEVVRVAPNELHFSNPNAYHDIYNSRNRWNKEKILYESFGEDRSSFGFQTYQEAKQRRDILAPLFSRRAVLNLENLVKSNVNKLCDALKVNDAASKSSDLFLGIRCFTVDTIISFCFAKSVNALEAPSFQAPIVIALEAALPSRVVFKHFKFIQHIALGMPKWLATRMSPDLEGMWDLQNILHKQIREVMNNPDSLKAEGYEIIYHRLLDKKNGDIEEGSLFEEGQALMFGGSDTVGSTLMLGVFHILENPTVMARLKTELKENWPNLEEEPTFDVLQRLPYLTAVIKEALRISPGVASALLRVVPAAGASISGQHIPGGTIVGMSGIFVHNAENIFPNPTKFYPDRWLEGSENLDNWLVAFSKGPRQCIGQNLAYCELYLAFAALFRRFDMKLDGISITDLTWRECFLPQFNGKHLQAFCKPVVE